MAVLLTVLVPMGSYSSVVLGTSSSGVTAPVQRTYEPEEKLVQGLIQVGRLLRTCAPKNGVFAVVCVHELSTHPEGKPCSTSVDAIEKASAVRSSDAGS